MAKQHAKRWIIEFQSTGKWQRSNNNGLYQAFFNRLDAENALKPEAGLMSAGLKYRIRSK